MANGGRGRVRDADVHMRGLCGRTTQGNISLAGCRRLAVPLVSCSGSRTSDVVVKRTAPGTITWMIAEVDASIAVMQDSTQNRHDAGAMMSGRPVKRSQAFQI